MLKLDMTKQEFKQKCIELRTQNYTLGEMVKILGRGKTTIYFHVKNLPKSEVLRAKLSQISRDKIISARGRVNKFGIVNQKGKSWLGRHPKEFTEWTASLVDLIAHTIFDGEINYSDVRYTNRSRALLENFREKMKLVYDYEPKRYKKYNEVITLAYNNVELARYVDIKKAELLNKITAFSKELKLSFLKAFFNDEGSVTFLGKKRAVRGYQHSLMILDLVKNLLVDFNIESKVDKKYFEIIVSRKENLVKFQKLINFSSGVRINGERSNSVWGRSLQKRDILASAINSYKLGLR
ncbi:MAG: hypothetical protein A3F25_02175 [Candidatus Yanofskybacteria bacterium RIFCSPHIGHO2_12_FULL_45_19b]|uniref:Homing endonuclease LAGLIDADG domain-containing protein n=1 Tax=Candidatus Yanofskybacteria bacterium RIFCSPHIGHO2_12_FULL_45_19b TaxID=1802689 RepID=A0A1F8G6T0_9BACT|nr:MAG: hypothetical protein A3F25_02175 [Candidatus Yanofskybacteria bacterium RIFCSPHIGHO2_12_FULL_45_19b]